MYEIVGDFRFVSLFANSSKSSKIHSSEQGLGIKFPQVVVHHSERHTCSFQSKILSYFRNASNYVVHEIADGFIPNPGGETTGSPGSAAPFYPEPE